MISCGIDIGSISTEVVIIDENKNILASNIFLTGSNVKQTAEKALEGALLSAGLDRDKIDCILCTGYGRHAIDYADVKVTEITCHAVGAHFLFPNTRTILDIGGQDSKVISLDKTGKVIDFVMNDKCAAGTGRFLEVMAHALEAKIDELGQLSLNSTKNIRMSSMCTVFTESEVVSKIGEGCAREDIAAGVHKAIVDRILTMAYKVGLIEEITLSGGVAKNTAIVQIISSKVLKKLNIPKDPQITGALGAAILAYNRVLQT